MRWLSFLKLPRMAGIACVVSTLGCAAIVAAAEPVPAFPGAEGFGANTTGGRGGKVLFVDSLDDDPRNPKPGTLRWACETVSGPRIVVFRVGGLLELARAIEVRHPDLTIAAQTAPGDGICLKGSGLSVESNNVIVRGLRSRAGDGKVGTSAQYRRSLQIIGPVSNVIVDHCSVGWGIDDDMTVYADKEGHAAKNLTIQWCILAECLYHSIHQQGSHSMALTMGGGNIGPFSFHHNLLAHHNGRNPRIVWGANGEFVNNIIYNWGNEATILEPFNPVKVKKDKRRPEEDLPAKLNFIGNQWIAGPNSTDRSPGILMKNATEGTAIYLKGNVAPKRPLGTPDGEKESAVVMKGGKSVVDQPAIPPSNVTTTRADEAKKSVLQFAGALAPKRDAVDARVTQEVEKGTGKIIDKPSDVGGYPNYAKGTAPIDSDADGMPDDWETAHHLDKNKANANGRDLDPRYDNVEVYVNELLKGP